jgi:hypothetical protein
MVLGKQFPKKPSDFSGNTPIPPIKLLGTGQ